MEKLIDHMMWHACNEFQKKTEEVQEERQART